MSTQGVKLRWYWRVMSLGILLVIYAALSACGTTPVIAAPDPGQITVKLVNIDPNITTVVGRVLETQETASLYQGKLAFQKCDSGHRIAVWAPGYAIVSLPCDGRDRGEYEIKMEKLSAEDNPNYPWVAADSGLDSAHGCAGCHSDASQLNEHTEWNYYGHSQAVVSPLFWTIYLGTNISRIPGEETRWEFSLSGERFRSPPDPGQTNNYGPGFQLDYPDASGNCAFCHAPAALGATQREVNLEPFINGFLDNRRNVATEGVTCDVCHKVIGVSLDEQNLPHIDRPGILSFSFLRPMSGVDFVTGPWAPTKAFPAKTQQTCVPIFSESSFCAPCHYAKFSGVEIYGSYKEWLDGPYSKPNQSFRSCQDCHMQSSQQIGDTGSAARSACSPDNHSFNDFSHNMMKRDNTGKSLLIEGAATVTVDAFKEDGRIKVNVVVVNTQAGHKFPTDSPLRHLILVVEARDENNRLLSQVEGPTIPDWGGKGTQPADYAGRPGVIYGNILKDRDTNMVPTIAYWNPTVPAWEGSDTRLPPYESVASQYSFVLQSHGKVTVTAHLFYRNAFIDIVRQKGWELEDILVNWGSDTVEE